MRDLRVTEVDVGCDACAGEKYATSGPTLFILGVLTGLAKDSIAFCTPHYRGFQRACEGLASKQSDTSGTPKEGA